MRFALLVPCVCFAFLALGSPLAVGKTAKELLSYSERVRLFLNATDSPVLFVGKVLKVNSNLVRCTVANMRDTTWSVSKVLFGFDPGKQVDVGFPSCGAAEAQFSSQDEMLVIAYPGYQNLWIGMKQSVVPATDANLLVASKAMDNYLQRRVRELVRPLRGRGGHSRPVLAFEGTVADLGPPRTEPCSSTVPPMFPVKFDVGSIRQGSWTEKQATVLCAGCGPLPNLPYRRVGRNSLRPRNGIRASRNIARATAASHRKTGSGESRAAGSRGRFRRDSEHAGKVPTRKNPRLCALRSRGASQHAGVFREAR